MFGFGDRQLLFIAEIEMVKTQAVGKHPDKDSLKREKKQVY